MSRRIPRTATGSDQVPTRPLSQKLAIITNTNALTADNAGLTSAQVPQESANVGGLISVSGSRFVVRRDPTVSSGLRFSIGHATDATGKVALIKIRGHRKRDMGNRGAQYRGSFLLAATLTAGAIDDTDSMLVPTPRPSQAASLKHVSKIDITSDKSLTPPGARVVSNDVGGIAELFIDDASVEWLEIEGSVHPGSGGTADCLTGEYTEL